MLEQQQQEEEEEYVSVRCCGSAGFCPSYICTQSLYLLVSSSLCLTVSVSVSLPLCLSASFSFCLFVCLSVSLSVSVLTLCMPGAAPEGLSLEHLTSKGVDAIDLRSGLAVTVPGAALLWSDLVRAEQSRVEQSRVLV